MNDDYVLIWTPALFAGLLLMGALLVALALVAAGGRRGPRCVQATCGRRNRVGARFCAYCGHALPASTDNPDQKG